MLPCTCFVAAAVAAALDMALVPLAFFKCIIDDTRLLLSDSLGDDAPSSQHARLLQVGALHRSRMLPTSRRISFTSNLRMQHARSHGQHDDGVPLIRFDPLT